VQSNQAYADAVVNFVQNALATSTATHTFIVAHYPLFGSAVEYGLDPTVGLFNVFPRVSPIWSYLVIWIHYLIQLTSVKCFF
jgi:hypothetical protein